jgi:hypothetical protein
VKALHAYLPNSTVTNYNTLYGLHIAEKFSRDTIKLFFRWRVEHQSERGHKGRAKVENTWRGEVIDSRGLDGGTLTIHWAKDGRTAAGACV